MFDFLLIGKAEHVIEKMDQDAFVFFGAENPFEGEVIFRVEKFR